MFRTFVIGAVIMLLRCLSVAQAECSVEAKVLLSPEQAKPAVASLNAGKETATHVYLYDTSALDLLSQGVVIRLRKGSSADLTVKVRSLLDNELSGASGGHEKFKCEVDIVGSEEQKSYSIRRKIAGPQVPETGAKLFEMLSAGQKDLLKQAGISIDWKVVKRIADIESTSWRVRQPLLSPMMLDLWQWPTGQVLELSARTNAAAGLSVYSQLQQLVTFKRLALAPEQRFKTTLVLQTVEPGITK